MLPSLCPLDLPWLVANLAWRRVFFANLYQIYGETLSVSCSKSVTPGAVPYFHSRFAGIVPFKNTCFLPHDMKLLVTELLILSSSSSNLTTNQWRSAWSAYMYHINLEKHCSCHKIIVGNKKIEDAPSVTDGHTMPLTITLQNVPKAILWNHFAFAATFRVSFCFLAPFTWRASTLLHTYFVRNSEYFVKLL